MASIDVVSLFTNIPLSETSNIIQQRIFSDNTPTFHNFTKETFSKLFDIATSDTYFTFKDHVYQQLDGVAMGSPLGPTLANIFMSYQEQTWLNKCPPQFKPVFYRRYIDDTFLLFHQPEHVPLFLEYLNQQHPQIKFTSDIEQNGQIHFLDINIRKDLNKFSTATYIKPTSTGL